MNLHIILIITQGWQQKKWRTTGVRFETTDSFSTIRNNELKEKETKLKEGNYCYQCKSKPQECFPVCFINGDAMSIRKTKL